MRLRQFGQLLAPPFDQSDLLRPAPSLDLLLPEEGGIDGVELLRIRERDRPSFAREGRRERIIMVVLPDPRLEFSVCAARVEAVVAASQDVCPRHTVHDRCAGSRPTMLWTTGDGPF